MRAQGNPPPRPERCWYRTNITVLAFCPLKLALTLVGVTPATCAVSFPWSTYTSLNPALFRVVSPTHSCPLLFLISSPVNVAAAPPSFNSSVPPRQNNWSDNRCRSTPSKDGPDRKHNHVLNREAVEAVPQLLKKRAGDTFRRHSTKPDSNAVRQDSSRVHERAMEGQIYRL